jgi:tight adherence protein B
MRRFSLPIAAALVALLGVGAPAYAEPGGLSIGHVEPGNDGTVQVLVSVPEGADVAPDDVTVTIDGAKVESTAERAGTTTDDVRRTTVIAFDTSDSMARQGRIQAAQAAASTFLESVPDDVYVGIVTFDKDVTTALEPTQDRAAAQAVVDKIQLERETRLNDGVIEAVKQAGEDGQRRILVLSDGKDTSNTPESDVTAAIKDAGVGVDVVALDQSGSSLLPLRAMSEAGKGAVIAADPAALEAAFSSEAAALARQIVVTATLPDSLAGNEATVAVSADIDGTPMTADAYAVVRDSAEHGPSIAAPDSAPAFEVSRSVLYAALAAIGLGLALLFAGLLAPARQPKVATAEDRISAYASGGGQPPGDGGGHRAADAAGLGQAKNAAAQVLQRNRGLEEKISRKLEAAGSALKPAEWLLLHGGITMAGGLLALLLGGGNFLIMLLGLLVGWVLPKFYLSRRAKRRLKAFNSGLADTLQLMSGSLSAGLSLAQSVDTVVREGNEPIAGEFKRVLVETRLGVSLEEALEGVAERMQSKDFEWVVMAIRIQRQVGGNLAELLNTVAATLRERDYLRRQVQSLSAEGKLSGYILGGLPPAMLVYLLMVRREYIMPMFTEPLGWGMLAGSACLLGLGAFLISRIVKVEV